MGTLVPRQPFAAGTRVDFLAYSIGRLPDPRSVAGRRGQARFVEKSSRDLRRWGAFHTLTRPSTPR